MISHDESLIEDLPEERQYYAFAGLSPNGTWYAHCILMPSREAAEKFLVELGYKELRFSSSGYVWEKCYDKACVSADKLNATKAAAA